MNGSYTIVTMLTNTLTDSGTFSHHTGTMCLVETLNDVPKIFGISSIFLVGILANIFLFNGPTKSAGSNQHGFLRITYQGDGPINAYNSR